MIATIAKRFTFDAAHRLDRLPPEHKCHRMHGHTYEVELVLSGAVDANGFVLDYAVIADLWAPLHEMLDHRVLNDVPGLEVPSTENLAAWICVRFGEALRRFQSQPHGPHADAADGGLDRVAVRESSTTWCEVRPHNLSVSEVDRFAPLRGLTDGDDERNPQPGDREEVLLAIRDLDHGVLRHGSERRLRAAAIRRLLARADTFLGWEVRDARRGRLGEGFERP